LDVISKVTEALLAQVVPDQAADRRLLGGEVAALDPGFETDDGPELG
jgi:hypothetical protein